MKSPQINESLLVLRTYWGKSQSELAEMLGVSQSLISEVESGRRKVSIDLLEKYSTCLDIPLSSILFFAEEIDNTSRAGRKRSFVSGKVLDLLKALIPDESEEQN